MCNLIKRSTAQGLDTVERQQCYGLCLFAEDASHFAVKQAWFLKHKLQIHEMSCSSVSKRRQARMCLR